MKRRSSVWSALPLAFLGLVGCSDDASDDAALDASGGSCTVEDLGNGKVQIRCPDGTTIDFEGGRTGEPGRDGAVGKDGSDGADGKDGKDGKDATSPCALSENEDGTHTLTCGDKSVVIGAPCENGFPGDVIVSSDESMAKPMDLLLFEVSGCTWVRGGVMVLHYLGEELPSALARIEKIDDQLYVAENENLERAVFPALNTIGRDVLFQSNPSLVEVSLPALESVGRHIAWRWNEALESLDVASLTTVGGAMEVRALDKLEHVTFPALKTAVSGVAVRDNAGVVEVELPALESLGTLFVTQNTSLEAIRGFTALTEVGGYVVWQENPKLTETPEFSALETIGAGNRTIDGVSRSVSLYWGSNASLETIGAFPKLATAAGEIIVDNHDALETIGGFDELTDVVSLTVRKNAKLANLSAFSSLKTIGQNLVVDDNAELASIADLGGITSIGGDFIVTNNAKLPVCDVVDALGAIQSADGIGGLIDYTGNDETDDSCLN